MRRSVVCALSLMAALSVLLPAGCGTNGPGSLSITTSALPAGTVGTAYSALLGANGGLAPYTFSVNGGAVPSGLSLSAAGLLAGTPTDTATSTFTVQVADATGGKTSKQFSLTVAAKASPLLITTTTLASGAVGTLYSTSIAATGGTTPYVFAVTGGSLPSGLGLSSTGSLAGTPAVAGSYSFSVSVADAKGQTAVSSFAVTIAAAATPPVITTMSLPGGTVGAKYSAAVAVSGGTTPYVFTISSGSAPTGLVLSSVGTLAGLPVSTGSYNFTMTVTDALGMTASQPFVVAIGASLQISTLSLDSGTVGAAYSQQVTATGGTAPYTYVATSGSVPPGLVLASSGVIMGTPTTAGPYSFTVTVTDAKNATASQAYSVTVAATGSTLALPALTLAAGTVNASYSAMIVPTGGTAPYSLAVTSGSVPAGTNLAPNGSLTGVPTTANTYSFLVTVTDAASAKASRIYSVEIDDTADATLLLTTSTLPNAILKASYSYPLSVSNGAAPYSYSVRSGSLPAGITLSAGGLLSGAPTAAGDYPFTVAFTDSASHSSSANVTLTVINAAATVLVDAATRLATVPANFFGLHTSVYDTNLTDTGTLSTLLANTGITTLRYPGGGYSDNYHWAQHAITPFYSTATGACGVVNSGHVEATAHFGNFARLLQASNTSGLITIDYGNSVADASATVTYGKDGRRTCSEPNTAGQPQEAAAWVAYANGDPGSTQVIGKDATGFDWKTVGFWATLRAASPLNTDDGYNFLRIGHASSLAAKFWEIGNELYYNGWATNHNAESDNHSPYIYPNGYAGGTFTSRASVPALSPTAYGTNAIQFIQAMKAVDSTIKIGVDFSSPISTDPIPTTWNPDVAQAVCAGTNIDFAIMHYYPGTYTAVQPGELLSLPQTDIPNVVAGIRGNLAQYCSATAGAIPVWLTETAPNNGLAANFPQPVIGLFTLNDFMSALTTGIQNIDWLELHDGSFLTESEVPGPSYYGILMAHQLAAVGDSAVKTTSSTSTIVSYATMKANGQKGVLLINNNPSSAIAVQVTVSGATLGSTATQYSFGVNTSQSGTALAGTSVAVPGNTFAVTVPAYTAVELILP